MTVTEILTLLNIGVLVFNVYIAYSNYKHSKQKEFHENLYKIKIEVYKRIIEQCHDAYQQLDINSTPFVEIYNLKDENSWEGYYQQNVGGLVHLGFDIEKTIFKETMFLPATVMETVYEFSSKCIRYVVIASNFNTELIIEQQDELHELFLDVINSFRSDLGIEIIDDSLKQRLNRMSV